MNTYWFCERCQAVGIAEHSLSADVMSVVQQIGDLHRSTSPNCEQGRYRLNVLNITEMLLRSSVPTWAVEPLKELLERST